MWELLASIGVGLWFGAVGPFGSYHSGPIQLRLLCFLLLTPSVTIVYGVVGRIVVEAGRRLGVSPWISMTVGIVILSLPMSRVVAFTVPLFLSPARLSANPLEWYLQTLAVMLPSGFIDLLIRRAMVRRPPAPSYEPGVPDANPPKDGAHELRLAQRLPASLGPQVLALQAEDHYVRVFTPRGSALVFMRLSDAIDELDGLEGLRTHRSWWIANEAIVTLVSKGRKVRLRLSNGLEAPVSRSASRSVKAFVGDKARRSGKDVAHTHIFQGAFEVADGTGASG